MKIHSVNILKTSTDISITTDTKQVVKYEPPSLPKKMGRKYEAKDRFVYGEYFYNLLFKNEIEDNPLTDTQLKQNILRKFDNYTLRQRFKKYTLSVGNIRTQYNKGILYSQQPTPYILSLCYNTEGRIVHSGSSFYTYLSFKECYNKCLQFKIADPRFIPHDTIEIMRNRVNSGDKEWLEWKIPDDIFIKELTTKLQGREPYDSIPFMNHLTRKATMK